MSTRDAGPNLAYCFQEVLTSVLRVRGSAQAPSDLADFRGQMRLLLQNAMVEAKALGYSSPTIQMALLAAIGFLDESILNLRGASVSEWTRRPLQEEIFGGHVAGETFFANLAQLLQQQDSAEVADALEMHCLCLELGFKGRLAFSSGGDIARFITQCRQKIDRIRGVAALFPPPLPAPILTVSAVDRLGRGLMITTAALALATAVAFAGYALSLSNGAARLASAPSTARSSVTP